MIKYILLGVAIFLLGSCATQELQLEDDSCLTSELYVLPDNVSVDDLLEEGSPEKWCQVTAIILNNGIGTRLLRFVKSLSPKQPFIHFKQMFDRDGNPELNIIRMVYAGRGEIGYTQAALDYGDNDGLLFHEFFHIFQYQGNYPTCNVSDEVEAYLAQYFYQKNKGEAPWIIDRYFTDRITILAGCIDSNTGYLRNNVNYNDFYTEYQIVLMYLEDLPWYSGDGWSSGLVQNGVYPFQRLIKLLNRNL